MADLARMSVDEEEEDMAVGNYNVEWDYAVRFNVKCEPTCFVPSLSHLQRLRKTIKCLNCYL